MHAAKCLIVNADDFGQSEGINRGVIAARESGIVTSASLMVRWPAAAGAAAYAREHAEFGVGLHIDLGEWTYWEETWLPLYEVVPLNDCAAIANEVDLQLACFRSLVGKDPTHIDSHQHVHCRERVRSVVLDVARRLAIPLRHLTAGIRYCGHFYGQTEKGSPIPDAVRAERLLDILAAVRPGFTELACHPGEPDDLRTMYRDERVREVQSLCDPRVRSAIAELGITLCSFRDVASGQPTIERASYSCDD